MGRLRGLLMSALFLAGMLTLSFNIPVVGAGGTVYIRPDGSVDPPGSADFECWKRLLHPLG